jgi:serine phosphatase RsbU (regulator of sigma subunit)
MLASEARCDVTDSLKRIIERPQDDTLKVDALNSLAWEIMYTYSDSSIKLSTSALELSRKIKYKMGEGKSYHNLGWFYSMKSNYKKSFEYYTIALSIWDAELEGNKNPSDLLLNRQASTYGNMGLAFVDQGNYVKALEFLFKAMKNFEKLGDQQKIATALGNIGQVYDEEGQYDLAIKYYNQALEAAEQQDDKRSVGRHLGNLGVAHYRTAEKLRGQKQIEYLNKSLDYYMRSRKIAEEQNNRREIARSSLNLGAAYNLLAYTKPAKEQETLLALAMEESVRARKASEEIGDTDMAANATLCIGQQLLGQKKYREAREAATLALNTNANTIKRDSYKVLAQVDSILGDPASAFKNLRLYYVYRDSLYNEEIAKQTVRNQMQYDFDKRESEAKAIQEQKDAEVERERSIQRIITWTIAAGLVLVLIIALMIFRSYREKNRANQIITRQKEEAEIAKSIIESRNKDITDSINYAQRIQKALLASEALLNANLPQWFIFFKPKDIVSGDFYWASKLHDGSFAIATADSTGHGVPGAIMSMLNIACLNESVNNKNLVSPKDILNHTRERVISYLLTDGSETGGKDGMDCSLLCIDFENMTLKYASANNTSWIVRNKEIIELPADKMPVGRHSSEERSFTEHVVTLEEGDMIYTSTDGFQDQFGGDSGKKYMQKRFRDLLLRISGMEVREQRNAIQKELSRWQGSCEQVDDICIVGIRVKRKVKK